MGMTRTSRTTSRPPQTSRCPPRNRRTARSHSRSCSSLQGTRCSRLCPRPLRSRRCKRRHCGPRSSLGHLHSLGRPAWSLRSSSSLQGKANMLCPTGSVRLRNRNYRYPSFPLASMNLQGTIGTTWMPSRWCTCSRDSFRTRLSPTLPCRCLPRRPRTRLRMARIPHCMSSRSRSCSLHLK